MEQWRMANVGTHNQPFSDSAVDIHSPHFWIDWSWKSSIVFVGSFVVAVVAIPWKWLLKSTSIILLTFHLFFPPPHSISLARFLPIIVDRCDEKCDLCPGTKVYVWIYAVHIFHNRESFVTLLCLSKSHSDCFFHCKLNNCRLEWKKTQQSLSAFRSSFNCKRITQCI